MRIGQEKIGGFSGFLRGFLFVFFVEFLTFVI
jgi:hypothetical protein